MFKSVSFRCEYSDCEVACNNEWSLKRHIKRTHDGPFKVSITKCVFEMILFLRA